MKLLEVVQFITPDDPMIRSIVQAFTTVKDIFDFVSSLKYVKERKEHWQLPRETLIRGAGDCEDLANLLTSLLRATGAPARSVIVRLPGSWYHVVTELEGVFLDPTAHITSYIPPGEPIMLFDERRVDVLKEEGLIFLRRPWQPSTMYA